MCLTTNVACTERCREVSTVQRSRNSVHDGDDFLTSGTWTNTPRFASVRLKLGWSCHDSLTYMTRTKTWRWTRRRCERRVSTRRSCPCPSTTRPTATTRSPPKRRNCARCRHFKNLRRHRRDESPSRRRRHRPWAPFRVAATNEFDPFHRRTFTNRFLRFLRHRITDRTMGRMISPHPRRRHRRRTTRRERASPRRHIRRKSWASRFAKRMSSRARRRAPTCSSRCFKRRASQQRTSRWRRHDWEAVQKRRSVWRRRQSWSRVRWP